jgi:hypothetical protein
MSEPLHIGGAMLWLGDCLEVLRTLPEASVDACVCDPPYDLLQAGRNGSGRSNEPDNPFGRHGSKGGGFMGLAWDATGVAFKPETWAEVLRVLKPGAHLLAFGGTRTYHRMACAIEDAGAEIRDAIFCWFYGTGFPKSLDVSKALDDAVGAERKVVGRKAVGMGNGRGPGFGHDGGNDGLPVAAPTTDAAKRWSGWGTALKPACEPCVVARKPLVGTVAANVRRFGTGGLNIDGCRIAGPPSGLKPYTRNVTPPMGGDKAIRACAVAGREVNYQDHPAGRWPANVILDEEAAAMLDEQSGVLTSGLMRAGTPRGPQGEVYRKGFSGQPMAQDTYADSGGASRFFYCAKPSPEERDGNTHPTVKPVALMRWLCRLVTPPGGMVLDPFMGSGTCGVAATAEGFRYLGIEREPSYFAIAERRLRAATAQGNLFAPRAAP